MNNYLLAAITAGILSVGAVAQSQDKAAFVAAFSGQWFVFDPQFKTGSSPCSLDLATEISSETARMTAKAQHCDQPLAKTESWDIRDGQLGLYSADQKRIATLGGSQKRITGELEDTKQGLIVERADGDNSTREISAAIRKHRCIYIGLTQKCAETADLRLPEIDQGDEGFGSVGIVVNLNVRDQPRSTAGVVGTLPKGSCLKVNYCTTASDGVWCRARFGEQNNWIRKTALRQGEWPVLTFLNTCPTPE